MIAVTSNRKQLTIFAFGLEGPNAGLSFDESVAATTKEIEDGWKRLWKPDQYHDNFDRPPMDCWALPVSRKTNVRISHDLCNEGDNL